MRALSACALALAAAPAARAADWDKPGYTLTFQDEFDGDALDTSQWERRFKWGEGAINGELEAYTDDQFAFSAGILSIVGEQKSASYAGMTMDYASGLIASVHHQTYGYFESRMKMPKGQGLWPAFWLLGENGTEGVNEIDIHEFLGHDVDTVYMTVHWGESYAVGHESDGVSFDGPDFTADFHTFAIDWEPDALRWYIDGVQRHSHTGAGIPAVEMYIIANLA
ncbi:MAG TPA: glycoside hydrolase family 16 protein, partial [Polyangiaceae bacterium]|nr:glycoside hydrolase family 16 protein [Polyangiaceae bacterium]